MRKKLCATEGRVSPFSFLGGFPTPPPLSPRDFFEKKRGAGFQSFGDWSLLPLSPSPGRKGHLFLLFACVYLALPPPGHKFPSPPFLFMRWRGTIPPSGSFKVWASAGVLLNSFPPSFGELVGSFFTFLPWGLFRSVDLFFPQCETIVFFFFFCTFYCKGFQFFFLDRCSVCFFAFFLLLKWLLVIFLLPTPAPKCPLVGQKNPLFFSSTSLLFFLFSSTVRPDFVGLFYRRVFFGPFFLPVGGGGGLVSSFPFTLAYPFQGLIYGFFFLFCWQGGGGTCFPFVPPPSKHLPPPLKRRPSSPSPTRALVSHPPPCGEFAVFVGTLAFFFFDMLRPPLCLLSPVPPPRSRWRPCVWS